MEAWIEDLTLWPPVEISDIVLKFLESTTTSIQKNDAIFHYVMIEAGCSDNLDVHIKGGQINEGPLYVHCASYVGMVLKKNGSHIKNFLSLASASLA